METSSLLPKEAVEEFKQIYKKVFKKDLSDEEAKRRSNNLIALYRTVYSSPVSYRKHRELLGHL